MGFYGIVIHLDSGSIKGIGISPVLQKSYLQVTHGTPGKKKSEPLYVRYYFAAVESAATMASEEAFIAFENTDVETSERDPTFKSGMEDVKKCIPAMREAADTIFTSFEEEGNIISTVRLRVTDMT